MRKRVQSLMLLFWLLLPNAMAHAGEYWSGPLRKISGQNLECYIVVAGLKDTDEPSTKATIKEFKIYSSSDPNIIPNTSFECDSDYPNLDEFSTYCRVRVTSPECTNDGDPDHGCVCYVKTTGSKIRGALMVTGFDQILATSELR